MNDSFFFLQNLFSGVVRIRSDEAINLNYWHKVRIARLDGYAMMQIDDGGTYSDQAKVCFKLSGTHYSLVDWLLTDWLQLVKTINSSFVVQSGKFD